MYAALALLIMSVSYFSSGFALSSHFDSDGVPLSELSWSSSLAVVAISFSGLFTFIFLMLACLCCKKGEIGFKEFENAEGDEYQADMSTLASPVSASSPDVYVLPLTEVSLPLAKQPGRSVQLLKSTDTTRSSLLYIKEIGHGWFGKVLLGEVTSGLSNTQVVVKELKTSASVQEQMHFLEEARAYRSLQHPALVQCLAQCTEVTPYLLIMEFCPLGDVKGYLRSCRVADTVTPDSLLLQRMACQIASGLLHLHKHDFTHSDLALRNCFLTSDITVKIGDYGLATSKYKDDYFVTSDQSCVPLRWIAPELVDDVHGNLLVADQTKQSNIWSLGVTIWELFELGNQPYRHYSDRQVLSFAVKEQQLKLPRPLLQFPLADRWYEVMQFCWLQPDQRPNAEEVHLLLSYLCAKGASEAEEEFERRWNSMRPNMNHGSLHGAGPLTFEMPQSSTTSSSFPLLEQFSAGDGYQSESGDDILTVTETSHGLNFEYKWEQARAKQPYHSSSTTGTLGQGNPHCQEIYYPPGGMVGGGGNDRLALGVSSQYYEPKQLRTPDVVPVLSAHSPSVNSEYYIRIEEPVDCNIEMDYTMCTYSPEFRGNSGSFFSGTGDSGDCMNCPPKGKPVESYWSADIHKSSAFDSDSSPTMSLTMEPLLGQVSDSSPLRPWESGHYVSYKNRDGGYYYEHSPPIDIDHYLIGDASEPLRESWGSRSLRQALGELEDPLGISPAPGSPPQAFSDPYLESSQCSVIGKHVTGGYYDMMGSLRKVMPGNHSVCIDIESGGAVFVGQDDSESEEEEDLFVERQAVGWTSNHSIKNSLSLGSIQCTSRQDAYAEFHYTMPMTDVEDAWPKQHSLPFRSAKRLNYAETRSKSNTCPVHGRQASVSSADCSSYIHLCHEPREAEVYPVPCCQALSNSHFMDPLTGSLVRNSFMSDNVSDKNIGLPNRNQQLSQATYTIGHANSKTEPTKNNETQVNLSEYVDTTVKEAMHRQDSDMRQDQSQINPQTDITLMPQQEGKLLPEVTFIEPESDRSRTVDSGVDGGHLSISLVDTDNCSDEDITDVTSGIFNDFAGDSAETAEYTTQSFKSLQKQVGTPDSMDSIDLPSTACSSETLSPTPIHPSNSPRAMDSGYDTENNESPEFVLKEPHEQQDNKAFIQPLGMSVPGQCLVAESEGDEANDNPQQNDVEKAAGMTTSESNDGGLTVLSEETPHRDSAYFSDTDAGKEKESKKDRDEENDDSVRQIEEAAEIVEKDGPISTHIISTHIVEQDYKEPNIPETEETSKNTNNIEEESLLKVSQSSPEPIITLSTSPERCKNLTDDLNHNEDHKKKLDNCQEESQSSDESMACENQSSDLTALPPSDMWPTVNTFEYEGQEKHSDYRQDLLTPTSQSSDLTDLSCSNMCPTTNHIKDEVLEVNLDDGQEMLASDCHSSDLTTLPCSDNLPEDNETIEADANLSSMTASTDDNSAINTTLDSFINEGDLHDEKDVVTSTQEEQAPQVNNDSSNLLITDSAKSALTDTFVDNPETPENNTKEEVQCHKVSTRPSSPPPHPSLYRRVSSCDGAEADEEDRDSDDSDESDEELRTYSIQEQSEESEDEEIPVPIIVSDCSDAHKLRSLLKMPSLFSDSLCDEMLSKKKVVSFFDDVTIYLFDQESPTRELAEHGLLDGKETMPGAKSTVPKEQEKVNISDDSSDGNISEESAGYEWEDDFSLMPLPTSPKESPPDVTAKQSLTSSDTNSKPVAQFSRFTVSPSPISRFSITHVSDSDLDSSEGSRAEDGERV
ncbi:serine/threonine-protein kinase LMTK1 [Trichomycterus rosablanca]|uniref:serine/threonine-protein kinase LMTK1 n=1 Tax=Trichomycterus rosablanca TaxID=2290929 RepID=UPI002F35DC32